jgi:predicted TIM-barrel fold metal-dependent hydrolase
MVQWLISADSHIDLGWLPEDAFSRRMDRRWGDAIPHVEEIDGIRRWVSGSVVLAGVGGVGSSGRPYQPRRSKRADRMAATGLYEAGHNRPGDPLERLEDQDRDGVFAEVLYGLHSLAPRLDDADLASAIAVAFNDHLAEFCSVAPDRLIGLACLPIDAPANAARELARCAGKGLRGAVIDIKNSSVPIHSEDWDVLWAAASETGLPVSFHLGGRGGNRAFAAVGSAPDGGGARRDAALAMSLIQYQGAADYFGIVLGGALDRFPDLQIVLAESGIGWIPHMLERLDYVVDNDYGDLRLGLRPSEYWHRQMYATFSQDQIGIDLVAELDPSSVMFASDYPHPDGVFPDSRTCFAAQVGRLSTDATERIGWQNAAQLYRVPQPVGVEP